jgi:hypothetical protein
VHFLRGDLEVALAFYDWAVRSDSADAGIRLNRAITYMALGKEERAEAEAAEGRKMAGGSKAAQALVGIRYTGEQPKASELSAQIQVGASPIKGNRRTRLSKDEVRALLGAGAAAGDQSAAKDGPAGTEKQKPGNVKPAGAASGTGTKASDEGNAATLLYWKR